MISVFIIKGFWEKFFYSEGNEPHDLLTMMPLQDARRLRKGDILICEGKEYLVLGKVFFPAAACSNEEFTFQVNVKKI